MVQARGIGCPYFAGRENMINRIGFVINGNDIVLDNYTTAETLALTGIFTATRADTGAGSSVINSLVVTHSTNSTYLGGSNIMYSGGVGNSAIRVDGTHSATTGGYHAFFGNVTASNDYTTDGHGVIVVKGVVTVTDTAVTAGDITGGQFIAKKAGSGVATAQVAWVGVEGWFYETGTSEVRTGIGGNFGWHADSTDAAHAAGSVWRGIQIFCDCGGTSDAQETTGLCIWAQAGDSKNAMTIAAASGTFTTGIRFNGGGTLTTGIKFGGTAIEGASNVTMTTAIDIDEIGSLTTGIALTAVATDAILIDGASADGIHISGNQTAYGINITGTCTTAAIMIDGTNKLMFDDSGMYMRASANGHLEIVSDDTITLSSPGHGSIVFGGETDWGTGATGHNIDGTGWDWCTQTVAHVDSGALAAACATTYTALTVTPASHSTASSFFGSWTELYIQATQTLTNAANAAAIWGQVECGATVTGPDQSDGDFMAAGYFNFITGATFTTGSYVNGVRIQSEVSDSSYTETASTWMAGLEILTKSGSYQDWTYGVKIAGSATGIDIGACTTSAINVAANVVLPKLISVGTFSNWVEWDQADEFIEIFAESTTAAGTKPMARIRLAGEADAAHTGSLTCLQVQTYNQSTQNTTNMTGILAEVGFKGACELLTGGTLVGVQVLIEDLHNNVTLTGDIYCLELKTQWYGASTSIDGESAFIYINAGSGAQQMNSVMRIDNGTPAYLIDFDDSGLPYASGTLDDSATADILCDGYIQVLVNATPYYIALYDTLG